MTEFTVRVHASNPLEIDSYALQAENYRLINLYNGLEVRLGDLQAEFCELEDTLFGVQQENECLKEEVEDLKDCLKLYYDLRNKTRGYNDKLEQKNKDLKMKLDLVDNRLYDIHDLVRSGDGK